MKYVVAAIMFILSTEAVFAETLKISKADLVLRERELPRSYDLQREIPASLFTLPSSIRIDIEQDFLRKNQIDSVKMGTEFIGSYYGSHGGVDMRVNCKVMGIDDSRLSVLSDLSHQAGLKNIVEWYCSRFADKPNQLGLRLVVAFGKGNHEFVNLNEVVRISIPVACGK